MSLENSNSKGKAVVKEEVSPLAPVEREPPKPSSVMSNQQDGKAMLKEEVSLPPILDTASAPHHHHQTPPSNDVSDNKDVLVGRTTGVAQDVGSSSASAAHMMQQVAMRWGLVAAPTVIILAFQQLDGSRILLIKEAMQRCVSALATGDVAAANTALALMSTLASADGDPLQRAAFAFAEALGRRALQTLLPGLHAGLDLPPRPAAAAGSGYTGAARLCFDALCPLLRVAASIANHEIVAATGGEERVHDVDLGGASPNQWLDLLHLLAARPGGAPSAVRLTVVGEEEALLSCAAWLLHREAARLRIPRFVFNPVRSHIDRLSPADVASFGVDRGEALAIVSTLQLHRLIADETGIEIELPAPAAGHGRKKRGRGKKQQPKRRQITMADALLRVLRDLSPKLLVLTEQEACHNGGAGLGDRVGSAFDYYAALFNDLEAGGGAARASAGRAAVERMLLREEIMDVVARDGAARRERHESMLSWAERMGMAGFRPLRLDRVGRFDAFADPGLLALQLSFHGTLRYWVAQDNTCFVIYANMTPMFSVTAWRPATETTTTGD